MKFSKEELKKRLTPEEYAITQEKGTEAPFQNAYWNEHEEGMYTCKVCGAELFSSDAKFDSGTGWPSFESALPSAVEFEKDNFAGMKRTEVKCAKCGAHLGHIFDDGPQEMHGKPASGKRFCVNSAGLCLMEKKK